MSRSVLVGCNPFAAPARFFRLAEAVAAGAALPDPDRAWLATVLQAIGRGQDPETAIRRDATAELHVALRSIRARHFADLPRCTAAQELAIAVRRFEADCWPRDRLKASNPYPADTLKAALWDLLQIPVRVPAWRTLADILA